MLGRFRLKRHSDVIGTELEGDQTVKRKEEIFSELVAELTRHQRCNIMLKLR